MKFFAILFREYARCSGLHPDLRRRYLPVKNYGTLDIPGNRYAKISQFPGLIVEDGYSTRSDKSVSEYIEAAPVSIEYRS